MRKYKKGKKNSSTLCHAIFCSTCDTIFYNDNLQSALWWPSVLFISFITNSFFVLVLLIFECSLLNYAVYHFFSDFIIVPCYICLFWIRPFDLNFSPKLCIVSLQFHLIFISIESNKSVLLYSNYFYTFSVECYLRNMSKLVSFQKYEITNRGTKGENLWFAFQSNNWPNLVMLPN